MNQQEKQIIKNIVAVLPMLDESNKKYLLGLSEGTVLVRKQENAGACLPAYQKMEKPSKEEEKAVV